MDFKSKILIVRALVPLTLVLCVFSHSQAAEKGKGLGDGHDGNRTSITHLITLYDEAGLPIKATDKQPRPISMRNTCGACHDYDKMATGWHFHSGTTNVLSGRVGEPWVLTDTRVRTQIPISNRDWKGTYSPDDINMTAWKFLKQFSSHFPGGNYGEMKPNDDDPDADPEEFLRWPISGKYEINCLACHHADRKQNQSDAALQAARENYRWAATVASGLATVKGTASELDEFYDPETEYKIITNYDKSRFDSNNKVFLDIVRKPPSNRCYYCHSTQDLQTPGRDEWVHNEDVHLASGMSCADCHRNGVDHMISRGDIEPSGNPHGSADYLKNFDPKKHASYSCQGCHLGNPNAENAADRMGGHLGAPIPEHKGIPAIHFEKLSCTACHSGRLPEENTARVRTARMHKLGLHGRHAMNKQLPHVVTPVFAKMANGKIGPHNMIWPSFWGTRYQPSFWGTKTGDAVTPLPFELEDMVVDHLSEKADGEDTESDPMKLSDERITAVLKLIATGGGDQEEVENGPPGDAEPEAEKEAEPKPEPVFVSGGKLYSLRGDALISTAHEEADTTIKPLEPGLVREIAGDELGVENENPERVNDWIALTEDQILNVLKLFNDYDWELQSWQPKPEPVYVAGGKLYSINNKVLVKDDHEAAEPYKWPIAHDVRPASQSLGSKGRCADCHDDTSPFIFGKVEVDTPINPGEKQTKSMTEFGELDPGYYQSFAFTFLFRPWLKGLVILASAFGGLVLLLFALKGMDRLVTAAGRKK